MSARHRFVANTICLFVSEAFALQRRTTLSYVSHHVRLTRNRSLHRSPLRTYQGRCGDRRTVVQHDGPQAA